MGGNVYNSGDVYIRAVVGQDGHLERGVKGDLRDMRGHICGRECIIVVMYI